MNYEWDPKKNRTNLKVHGIRFEDAIGIFDGATLERVDDRFDYGETRVFAIGVVEWSRSCRDLRGHGRQPAENRVGKESRTS